MKQQIGRKVILSLPALESGHQAHAEVGLAGHVVDGHRVLDGAYAFRMGLFGRKWTTKEGHDLPVWGIRTGLVSMTFNGSGVLNSGNLPFSFAMPLPCRYNAKENSVHRQLSNTYTCTSFIFTTLTLATRHFLISYQYLFRPTVFSVVTFGVYAYHPCVLSHLNTLLNTEYVLSKQFDTVVWQAFWPMTALESCPTIISLPSSWNSGDPSQKAFDISFTRRHFRMHFREWKCVDFD